MPSESNIASLVASRAKTHPDLDVLTFEDNAAEETRTYLQLWQNGQRVADALARSGMRRGDRFALLMQNHPEFVEAMVASATLAVMAARRNAFAVTRPAGHHATKEIAQGFCFFNTLT